MKEVLYQLSYITLGCLMGIEPTHIGITTRGLTTWRQTPYRNTLGDVLKVPLDDPKSLCFRMCFYIANSLRAGLEPARGVYFLRPHNGPMSTIPSPRVPEVNYSPAWMLPADNTSHIETHYLNLCFSSCPHRHNVFLYGGPTGIRTQTLTG